jgi:MoaA/NifB/PqqE/SkfB family radical SAM enzyme
MERTRAEHGGILRYEPDSDEFLAESGDNAPLVISRPISAGCLITGKCNLGCGFCYGNDESLPSRELTAAQWSKIFAHLKSWGLMRVDLSGGEPTFRKDIGVIARSAMEIGLNTVLSTNGLLLTDARLVELSTALRVHVSLDSGFQAIHESSRILRSLMPSPESFPKTSNLIRKLLARGHRLRIMTCVGRHNQDGLFELGEHLALLGVLEWNISRILKAGRAAAAYETRWVADDQIILEQIHDMREAYPWVRIRYSDRTDQNGYFLLVLPDGSLATQWTDHRDKVKLGEVLEMSLEDLQNHPEFSLERHARKWIAASIPCQSTEMSNELSCPGTKEEDIA